MQAFKDLVRERAEHWACHFLSKNMPGRLAWARLEELHPKQWVNGVGDEVWGL
jgi:hypothetical protein